MFLKKIILAIILFGFSTSCKKEISNEKLIAVREKLIGQNQMNISPNNKLTSENLAPVLIKVPELPGETLNYSTIIDTVQFIPLETKNEALFGDIDEMVVNDTYIFILDKIQKKVLCFDKNGEFRYKINTIGKGPKEFMTLSDMFVENEAKKLHILDNLQNKILTYGFDGNYIKEEIIDFVTPFQNFAVHEDNFLIDINNKLVPGMFPELEYDIIAMDSKGNIESRNLPYKKIFNFYQYNHPTSFLQYKNTLQYISFLKQKVYSISSSSIKDEYYIDFGKDNIVEKDFEEFKNYKSKNIQGFKKMKQKMKTKMREYSTGPVNFLESNSHVIFNYHNQGNSYNLIYNKKSKKAVSNAQVVYDHKLGTILRYALPIAVDNNSFYGIIYPNTILDNYNDLIKNLDDNDLKQFNNNYPEYYSMIQEFEKNENANPYISIIKFKDF